MYVAMNQGVGWKIHMGQLLGSLHSVITSFYSFFSIELRANELNM